MGNMRFKVGDRVRIKSIDWYNENKDKNGFILCGNNVFDNYMSIFCGSIVTISWVYPYNQYAIQEDMHYKTWTDEMFECKMEDETKPEPKFKVGDKVRIKSRNCIENFREVTQDMLEHCEMIMTIDDIHRESVLYIFKEDCHKRLWSAEMIEGLVEEETKPKFKVGDKIKLKSTLLNDIFGVIGYEPEGYRITNISNGLMYFMSYSIEHYYELVEEEVGLVDNLSCRWVNEFNLPDGYIFKDENGNVINATMIVLEKKKKEYPNTYEECCKVLGVNPYNYLTIRNVHCYDGEEETTKYERDLLGKFDYLWKLRICRDAYWKIAGDEMRFGKSWEPDYDSLKTKYTIVVVENKVVKLHTLSQNRILIFPTEEMRDAFYENFKELIEQCKELL